MITALDSANVRHKEIMTTTRTKLVVMVGPLTIATEIGTNTYVLYSLLGGVEPGGGGHPPIWSIGLTGTGRSGCA